MNGKIHARRMAGAIPQESNADCSMSESRRVEVRLEYRQVFTLPGDRRGGRLTALQGILWVTQQGDEDDFVLGQGESFTVTRRGMVVVQGMCAARLCYIPA
jgi:hypothetical protein